MEHFYKNNREHIYEELLLVDLLIHAEVEKFRKKNKEDQNRLKGLYISEEEVDELLEGNPVGDIWTTAQEDVNTRYEELLKVINKLSRSIQEKIKNSIQKKICLKLVELAELFSLSTQETDILCICLAPHFNTKYRKLFAYLRNDVTRKNPSVDLIMNLITDTFERKLAYWEYFSEQSPLFKNNLLEYIPDPYDNDKPLLSREIKVNNRIVGFILESFLIAEELSSIARIYRSAENLKQLMLPDDILQKIQSFCSFYKKDRGWNSFLFSFYGPYGSQKKEVASAVCNALGIPLLEVDLLALRHSSLSFEYGIDLILREGKLLPVALFFENCDFLFSRNEEESYIRKYFVTELDKAGWLTFLSSDNTLSIQGEFLKQKYIEIFLPVPTYEERKFLWEKYLAGYNLASEIDLNEISGKFNLTSGQIKDVVATASTFAVWRTPDQPEITSPDLHESCHIHSNKKLGDLAFRIKPRHGWEDIVLPVNIIRNLKEIVSMVRHKHIVYNEWGFDKKLSLGKGVSVLFYGESGTGKTLASGIIAHELGMEIYKIDISMVVSKYVGETEKNLAAIFNAAEQSNAVLFFDEADALFGKRTEVKDAHDRYANIEVSYLLQKIDEYTGLVIMATNFYKNIDQAFERRLHFAINFPFPDEEARYSIWKNIFPGETPLDEKIDLKYFAKKYNVSGGNIKNIALQAAFFAAEAGGILTTEHIMRAGKREFDKMGRLWDDKDFNE